LPCVRDEVFELPSLVAAETERREVITLDQDSRAPSAAAQRLSQSRRFHERCRQRRQRDSRLRSQCGANPADG
jgi:hypothetical protein